LRETLPGIPYDQKRETPTSAHLISVFKLNGHARRVSGQSPAADAGRRAAQLADVPRSRLELCAADWRQSLGSARRLYADNAAARAASAPGK